MILWTGSSSGKVNRGVPGPTNARGMDTETAEIIWTVIKPQGKNQQHGLNWYPCKLGICNSISVLEAAQMRQKLNSGMGKRIFGGINVRMDFFQTLGHNQFMRPRC